VAIEILQNIRTVEKREEGARKTGRGLYPVAKNDLERLRGEQAVCGAEAGS
jgi:hypothetical protein